MLVRVQQRGMGTLVAPSLLLAGLMLVIAGQAGVLKWPAPPAATTFAAPETVTIAPRPFSYRAAGEFLRAGRPVEAPLITISAPWPLDIMAHEVGAADYAACVAEGACRAAEPRRRGSGDVPVTGVSLEDANAYALWLSGSTGQTWRLPTLEEWVFAAGAQVVDPALGVETDGANPAERWLAQYEKEATLGASAFATPGPRGSLGANEFGVFDIEGPVWEWTSTCHQRTVLDEAGAVLSRIDSCGVRLVEGRHRAAMSYFVRDARSGGCAVGAPPDNLGFRLVREPSRAESLWRGLTGWMRRGG